MVLSSTSPNPIRPLDEQLLALQVRRSVVDRLIRCLELYQRVTPSQDHHSKTRVA